MDPAITHKGSRDNLLGTSPDPALVAAHAEVVMRLWHSCFGA